METRERQRECVTMRCTHQTTGKQVAGQGVVPFLSPLNTSTPTRPTRTHKEGKSPFHALCALPSPFTACLRLTCLAFILGSLSLCPFSTRTIMYPTMRPLSFPSPLHTLHHYHLTFLQTIKANTTQTIVTLTPVTPQLFLLSENIPLFVSQWFEPIHPASHLANKLTTGLPL
jgi:hypothetical protein